jgi:hypothetical protein
LPEATNKCGAQCTTTAFSRACGAVIAQDTGTSAKITNISDDGHGGILFDVTIDDGTSNIAGTYTYAITAADISAAQSNDLAHTSTSAEGKLGDAAVIEFNIKKGASVDDIKAIYRVSS